MARKLTIEDCQKYAKNNNGKCLSTEYINNKTKMSWMCENGHILYFSFRQLKKRAWCKYCSGLRYTIEDCKKYAKDKDGYCLSSEYSSLGKLKWRCQQKHIWFSRFLNMVYDSLWCPYCAGRFTTIRDCNKTALSKNGKCISDKYTKNSHKYTWQCDKGHVWAATYNNIKRGHWCPKCSDTTLTIQDCHNFAISKNGKCLSNKYINCYTKMKWQCNKGHAWHTSFRTIRNEGSWCPFCCIHRKQEILQNIISKIFKNHKIEANFNKFGWLKNPKTNRKLFLDIWVPEIKVALEYDGEQHFMPIRFNGVSIKTAEQRFKQQQYRDKLKDYLITQHSMEINYFVRFNYTEDLTEEYVLEKLRKAGIDV